MKLIDKDALVAEIKRLEERYKKCPTRNSYEDGLKTGRLIGYKDALYKITSLEVKEVSDDFEEALANEWKGYIDRGAATVDALEDNTQELAFAKGFYRGANWKEQKDSIISDDLEEACEQLAENARIRKAETISRFFSPTDYKQGVIDGANWKEKQMIAKAIDATVSFGKSLAIPWLGCTLDKMDLKQKDKVKVIVIKED